MISPFIPLKRCINSCIELCNNTVFDLLPHSNNAYKRAMWGSVYHECRCCTVLFWDFNFIFAVSDDVTIDNTSRQPLETLITMKTQADELY